MVKAIYNLLIATAKANGCKVIANGCRPQRVKTAGKFNRITINAVDGFGNSYYYKFTTEGK